MSLSRMQEVDRYLDQYEAELASSASVDTDEFLAGVPETIVQDVRAEILALAREREEKNSGSDAQSLDQLDESIFHSLFQVEAEVREQAAHDGLTERQANSIGPLRRYARQVRRAFHESISLAPGAQDTPSTAPSQTRADTGFVLGEYELVRELGRGGFGVVYEARHVKRGDRVALKTLPVLQRHGPGESSQEAERLHRFRQEFRTLSEINHPNLAGMQSLEICGKQWFFTMDLVDGTGFLSYVRPDGVLNESRLRTGLKQLVVGIQALHEHGVAHCDLKPSNVMVSPNGRLTILDFGLVARLQTLAGETLSLETLHFAGTPRYAAPEQVSGKRESPVDLYAIGVMIYEALTGQAPFQGAALELLVKKQTGEAPKLVGQANVPGDLAALADALLQREPSLRPEPDQILQLAGLGGIGDARERSLPMGASTEGSDHSSWDPLLIGRDEQIAALEKRKVAFLKSRTPQAVLLSGRSGEGKTTLAEHFLSEVKREKSMLVLGGRCYDRESVPFKAIDCWTDALVSHLKKMDPQSLLEVLPQDIGMLARLFPVLRRVSAIDQSANTSFRDIDSRQARYRVFAALAQLLQALGSRKPVILFIDDVQWGDADSAAALFEILSQSESPRVMLLLSFRVDEADASPFLTAWRERQQTSDMAIDECEVQVAPLTEEQCLQFASERLDLAPEAVRRSLSDVHRGTAGNPYFLEQLLDSFDSESEEIRIRPLMEIIDRKLAKLPAGARSILEIVAVGGQACYISEVAPVSDAGANAFSVLVRMRSERLVRLVGSDAEQRVDTYHDKIRESILTALDPGKRQEIHLRLASQLEENEGLGIEQVIDCLTACANSARNTGLSSDRIFDIAHHYHGAKHPHAFCYQLLAGVTSLMSYAGEEALAFLRRANAEMPEETDHTLRYLLHLSLARAYLISKEPDQASQYLQRALQFAESDLQKAMVYLGMAKVDRFLGYFQEGIAGYDEALRLIGAPRPRTKIGSIVSILWDNFSVMLSGTPKSFRDPQDLEESDQSVLRYAALREVGGLLLEKDIFAFVACASKACRMSVSLGTAESLVTGYEWAAGFLAAAGLLPVAKIYHRRAQRVEEAANDPQVTEQRLLYYFGYNYFTGNLPRSEHWHALSWKTARRLGEHNEAIYHPHMLRHNATFMRPTSKELHWGEVTLEFARELGNEQQLCWGTYDVGVALARRGNLDQAKEKLHAAQQLIGKEPHHMTESIRGASLGFICLQCSDYMEAQRLAGDAWRNAVKHLVFIDVAIYSLPVYMESLCGPNWLEGIEKPALKKLRHLCWWNFLLFPFCPNHQPHLLRILGRYQAGRGRLKKASTLFRRSLDNARARGMDYAVARALLDLAAVQAEGSEANRKEAISLLAKMEAVLPHAEKWLLGDLAADSVIAGPTQSES